MGSSFHESSFLLILALLPVSAFSDSFVSVCDRNDAVRIALVEKFELHCSEIAQIDLASLTSLGIGTDGADTFVGSGDFQGMTSLESLGINGDVFYDVYLEEESFSGLNLRELNISCYDAVHCDGRCFADLTVKRLRFYDSNQWPIGAKFFSGVIAETIDLTDNKIADFDIKALTDANVTRFFMHASQLSDSQEQALIEAYPNILFSF